MSDKRLHIFMLAIEPDDSSRIEVYEGFRELDPSILGIALADAVRTLASAFQDLSGIEYNQALNDIMDSFLVEMNSPTTTVQTHRVEQQDS